LSPLAASWGQIIGTADIRRDFMGQNIVTGKTFQINGTGANEYFEMKGKRFKQKLNFLNKS